MLVGLEHIQYESRGNPIVELTCGSVPPAIFYISQPLLNVSWHKSLFQLASGAYYHRKKLLQSWIFDVQSLLGSEGIGIPTSTQIPKVQLLFWGWKQFAYKCWKFSCVKLCENNMFVGWLKYDGARTCTGPPMWSSGQSSWLQIQRFRVRFPVLPDFLRNSGSGTGSTQPREDNWGATWMKK
jgi:hypothetical protein